MALVNKTDLLSMDYSYLGEPFLWYCANPSDETSGMDFSYLGEPFVINPGASFSQNISKVNTASWWSRVKKIGGKLITDIQKINQTEP